MLEQLLEQLWEQEKINASLKAKELAELAPLTEHANTIKQAYRGGLEVSAGRIAELKVEILKAMPEDEKTVKLERATLTKRVARRLKVLDGNLLYEQLRVLPAVLAKVTYSFTKCKIIDLVDAGALTLGSEAEIVTSENLVIKKN